MGTRTTIYGHITEMDFWEKPIINKVRKHNSKVISSLPVADNWPPLSREMFAICNNHRNHPGTNLEYWGRVIHFGANLKSVEQEWNEWKLKFESLLERLYFMEARVHFKVEYAALQTSSWRVDLLKYKVVHDGKIPAFIKKTDWDYESTYDN